MTTTRKLNSIARAVRQRRGRQIVLVDLENLVGGADATGDDFAQAWGLLRHGALSLRPGDVVAVATSRFAAQRAVPALLGEPVQWRWRDRSNGAELALLELVDVEFIAQRYSRLVIASGDRAFATLAGAARRRGMAVHQVVGRGGASRELWDECTTHARLHMRDLSSMPVAA